MSSDDLRSAAEDALKAADMIDKAAELASSNDPTDKAQSALLSQKSDRAAEAAQGGIRRHLGLSNEMGARLKDRELHS